ncbi:TetR family transcriptional regulator [Chitinophaga oryziterrae]|uniref:TetR family transcriptional regulator n=1 Tax=Chitinophaga oryziterrae TaxID=1031224 RepID=A0A6N8JIU6_9BACT|nr:TetR/AcrR family transcriptional regulator [Chitinophaga oryziterrae]MVT44411.1 TetR family transcriptional regulator [Chitinophaga oryziterrae]
MGITDRKEREKLEMRRLIMDAAMDMFVKDGYEKTSIRNIADKIEYSPATIYLYYKDKDELLWGLQTEAFEKLANVFREGITAIEPIQQLRQMAKLYVEFGMGNPDLYDLMFIIRSPMNAEKNEEWKSGSSAFQFLMNIIQAAIDKLKYENVMIGALSCWSMVHGLVSLNVRGRCKVLEVPEDKVQDMLQIAVDQYIDNITR